MGASQQPQCALTQLSINLEAPSEYPPICIPIRHQLCLLGSCKCLCQAKQNPHSVVLGSKTRLLSYLANPLVSVPYPKANNLQMIRSLSAPFQMGRMKREHIAILCLFSSKPRRASRPWHRLGRAGKLQIATLTSTMEINQEHEKLATRTQEKNTEKYTALFKNTNRLQLRIIHGEWGKKRTRRRKEDPHLPLCFPLLSLLL